MAPRKETKYIEVSRDSNLRDYTYTAYLCPKTGKLHHIKAGCRNWKTWDDVNAHYWPTNPEARWGSAWVRRHDRGGNPYFETHRLEALAILYRLKWHDAYQVEQQLRLKRLKARRTKARRRK